MSFRNHYENRAARILGQAADELKSSAAYMNSDDGRNLANILATLCADLSDEIEDPAAPEVEEK